MAELIVVGFDNITEADQALTELRHLQKEYLIDLEDAVVAIRNPDGKVQLKQSIGLVAAGASGGALWGAIWGSLVGMLFLNPLAGFAIGGVTGAGAGALSGKFSDYGINDDFIKSLADTIPANTSALFILVRKAQPEKVLKEMSRFHDFLIIAGSVPLPMQKSMPTHDDADKYLDKYFHDRTSALDANDFLYQVNASRNYVSFPQLEKISFGDVDHFLGR